MKSFSTFIEESKHMTEQRRKASDIKSDEISLFISSMQNLVSKYRRTFGSAQDIWADYVMTGKFIEWLEANIEPRWEKYGYPELGSKTWGEFQQEVIKKYLLGK